MARANSELIREIIFTYNRMNRQYLQLESQLTDSNKSIHTEWSPQVDIMSTDQQYILEASLPGMKAEDIAIEFQSGELQISGTTAAPKYENAQCLRLERGYGNFARKFTFDQSIREHEIRALYEHGLLRIVLPIAAPQAASTQIEPI